MRNGIAGASFGGKYTGGLTIGACAILFAAGLATVAGRFGQIAWPLELMSHFAVQLLAVQVAGTAVLMIARRARQAAAFLPFLLINLLVVAPYLQFPTWRAEAAGGPTRLTVMAANIQDSRHRVDLLLAEIRRIEPDVVLLVEPTAYWHGDRSPLRATHPYVIFHRDGAGTGIMMASRIPWERASTYTLSSRYSPSVHATFCPAPERGPAGCVDLLGVHPVSPIGAKRSRMRDAELRAIAEFVRQRQPERFVVLGDFNTTPWSVRFSELLQSAKLRESPVGRGLTATWRSKSPIFGLPIDHVLVGRDIDVVHQEVGRDIGSDHYPVSATLAF
ncbi:MAG: endonuclease/exonuclease/phosphatase family protein [Rhodospirillales bacterium]|nr:endonuclease/exonuclease/phosphatase family protein [Rhodospirillales bacterium]